MDPRTTSRDSRSSSYEKLLFIGFALVAVISPLYIGRAPASDLEDDEQPINLASWLPLLPFLLIFAIALSLYIDRGVNRRRRTSSFEKFMGLGMGLLAVVSPLYINRRPDPDPELEESIDLTSWLPPLLLMLVLAIVLSLYLDQSLTRFDPNWIHRVGGSSGGIILILVILALVLKCKAFHG